jgi:hypothetical protein
MIKPFLLLVSGMFLLLGGVIVHAVSMERTAQASSLSALAAVTGIASPALSVAYYEPRIYFQEKAENPAYPQMPPLNRMDVVYAE